MYKEIWYADVGEELSRMREVDRDPLAVAVVCVGFFHGLNFGGLPINRKNYDNWTRENSPLYGRHKLKYITYTDYATLLR